MELTNYPTEIVKIAEQYITKNNSNVKTIVPIYNRGFIAVLEDDDVITFKPYIQIGTYDKDYINIDKSDRSFNNYDEAIIALITFKNLGQGNSGTMYIDIYCNKMAVTTNSINPQFKI